MLDAENGRAIWLVRVWGVRGYLARLVMRLPQALSQLPSLSRFLGMPRPTPTPSPLYFTRH